MNVAVDLTRPPGDQRNKNRIYFDWADHLALSEQQEILSLMNLVLENEDSSGFPGPLAWDEGMSLLMRISDESRFGIKRLLLTREKSSNAIVGFILLIPNQLPASKHLGEISQVFFHPKYNKNQLIELGIKEVLLESQRLGIEIINVEARADSELYRLWQRLGFETVACVRDHIRFAGLSFDGCYMRQSVKVLMEKSETEFV
jgi:hypothetical protein